MPHSVIHLQVETEAGTGALLSWTMAFQAVPLLPYQLLQVVNISLACPDSPATCSSNITRLQVRAEPHR